MRIIRWTLTLIFTTLSFSALSSPSKPARDQALIVIEKLRQEKSRFSNNRLAQNAIDRIIFGLEARYNKGPLDYFLVNYLITQAEIEKKNEGPLVLFFAHLSDVVRAAAQERDNLSLVITQYIEAAPLDNPKPASRFILGRSYSNGQAFEQNQWRDLDVTDQEFSQP